VTWNPFRFGRQGAPNFFSKSIFSATVQAISKVDSKFLGWGTFWSSPPWGAFVRHLTLADFGPRDPDKNGFCSGGIAPYLGDIWSLAGVHFGPLFLEIVTCDF